MISAGPVAAVAVGAGRSMAARALAGVSLKLPVAWRLSWCLPKWVAGGTSGRRVTCARITAETRSDVFCAAAGSVARNGERS